MVFCFQIFFQLFLRNKNISIIVLDNPFFIGRSRSLSVHRLPNCRSNISNLIHLTRELIARGFISDHQCWDIRIRILRVEMSSMLPEAKKEFVLSLKRWVVERSFAWTAFDRLRHSDASILHQSHRSHLVKCITGSTDIDNFSQVYRVNVSFAPPNPNSITSPGTNTWGSWATRRCPFTKVPLRLSRS